MATFKPHISPREKPPEFTLRTLFLGILLSLIFGVGNAYLGLKMGTTVSASIPAAVLSMAILRTFSKRVSILENNMVQTIATVGEGLAAGVIFTVPALFLINEHPSPLRIFILSCLGGILGILFMIPMRRYLIVQQHNKFPFPEGTACAEILKSGERGLRDAKMAIGGIFVGAIHQFCTGALYLWNEVISWVITPFQRTVISMDCTTALLGVGFIIGTRVAAVVMCGGLLSWLVLIPLIRMFGEGTTTIISPALMPISQMSSDQLWSHYVRYIGVGTLAYGGLSSLFKIGPLVLKTLRMSFLELFQNKTPSAQLLRTDRDISLRWLVLGSITIILCLWLLPTLPMNFFTVLIMVLFAFFFVAVTSMTVGIIGSTSNPTSGMTIMIIILTGLVFLSLGWTDRAYLTAMLTMSIAACVTITMAATTAQDLKTGYLLGATPRLQQIGEIIGVLLPAATIGGTVYMLNAIHPFGSPAMPAPQGTMISMVAQGIIHGELPFTLVAIGVMIGIIVDLVSVPVLPFALGLYLPLSLTTPMFLGGLVSFYVRKKTGPAGHEAGVICSSGLVAGATCMGVLITFLNLIGWVPTDGTGKLPNWVALLIFLALTILLAKFLTRPKK